MQISTQFAQDVAYLNKLIALLNQEQSALTEMNVEVVEGLLDDKNTVLQKMTLSAKQRYEVLQKEGFSPNENGMADWIRANGMKKEQAAWQAFQKSLEQAKELNRVNGQLINNHFKRNQAHLEQLQGSPKNAGIYGANGLTTSQSSSRKALAV